MKYNTIDYTKYFKIYRALSLYGGSNLSDLADNLMKGLIL